MVIEFYSTCLHPPLKGAKFLAKNLAHVKLVTVTNSGEELEELIPLLRELYFGGSLELLCLVNTEEEAALQANPAVHRRLREFCLDPLEEGSQLKGQALLEAARNALLEERPDAVLWPSRTYLREALRTTIKQLGMGEHQLESEDSESCQAILKRLRNRVHSASPAAPGKVTADAFMDAHWDRLGPQLKSPCLLKTSPQLAKLCAEKFPHIDFHQEPALDSYQSGLSLLELSFSEKPGEVLDELHGACQNVLSLEPVNSPISGALYNFCYGAYDNEFALESPEMDLKEHFRGPHRTSIWDQRSGQAGTGKLPHPDGKYPAFFTAWSELTEEWTHPYQLPPDTALKIVFADSGNVACSVLHHTEAVNRFTNSKAWAITGEPHPFIGPRESNETTFFTKGAEPSGAMLKALEEADCVVFFEDDDEHSTSWSFPIKDYIENIPKLHLYIGYRVHAKTPKLARPGRTILTPLPHLLKMYPESHFYAGFPPLQLLDIELEPPRSASDGVCRFLHTPSLPHWTTARYPYHKDTHTYLASARKLKAKHGSQVEFHQVGGWAHCEVLKARQFCDVTFNQLRGFHGLSGDEAMFLGRPCVQFFDQFNTNRHLEYWGLDCQFPWLTCHAGQLTETFEALLLDPKRRVDIGTRSVEFMRKYFSPQKGILPLLFHCYQAVQGGPSGEDEA